jgi:hypothetical protein
MTRVPRKLEPGGSSKGTVLENTEKAATITQFDWFETAILV